MQKSDKDSHEPNQSKNNKTEKVVKRKFYRDREKEQKSHRQ